MVMGPQSRVWNGPKYTTSLWDWGFFHQDPLIFVRLVGPQLKEQESHISHLHKGLVFECHFTPWTIKSDHVAWPFPVVQLPWSSFLTKSIYKAFGPLARCKPNVNQEEWPCTKKRMRWFCLIHVPKRRVWKKVHVGPLCCPLFPKRFPLKIQCNNISWPWGPWPFSTRAPLLPPPPQNPLDHINAWRRPSNMSFGDLELHGHSNYFSFPFPPSMQTEMIMGRVQRRIKIFTGPWDDGDSITTVQGENSLCVFLCCGGSQEDTVQGGMMWRSGSAECGCERSARHMECRREPRFTRFLTQEQIVYSVGG